MTAVAPVLRDRPGHAERAQASIPRGPRRPRRVRLIQQLAADDCGAACLAMVLGARGIHGVAAECRELCGGGRDGTTLRTLIAVAGRFGMTAQAAAVSPDKLDGVTLPAIAHWERRHFVVIERWTARRVTIVDPAFGRRVLSATEFAAAYSGIILTVEPGANFVRLDRERLPLWIGYLTAMFSEPSAKGALLQLVIASLVVQATGLAAPLFTKLVVDEMAPGSGLSLGVLAAAMTIAIVARTIATFIRGVVMIRLQSRLDARLTKGFFDHLLRLPYAFFQGRNSGDLLMRLSSNTMIREVLTTQLLSLLLDGPLTLVYLAVLAVVDPSFAALVLGLAVTQAAVVLASLRPLHDLGQRTLVAKSDEQSCLVELMKGIAYVKASGAEQPAYERWVELFSRQLGVFVDRAYFSAKVDVVLGLVRTASPLVLLWYGASLVASGTMPLGTMLGLTALATLFLTPFVTLVQSSQQLQLLEAYVERLADVLQAAPEATAERPSNVATTLVCRRSCPAIEARQLTYRFAPGGPAIVDDVSFSVRAGEKLGIVGPTGSGKSTVLMLLLGLYRPDEGEIYYDGVALTEMDPREVRRRCGVVLQDVSLFGGSIHSNIALGAPWASHEDVVRAATLAGIHNDITAFPMGYETRLAESGSNLSGGQRQRVAIARALVHRPDMLLLDEASSHLDVASEQRLNANLESLRCTRVVVAHRLTAVRSADQILVMRAGRVVERGSHFELVQLGREYAALAAAQTSSPTRREGETWS